MLSTLKSENVDSNSDIEDQSSEIKYLQAHKHFILDLFPKKNNPNHRKYIEALLELRDCADFFEENEHNLDALNAALLLRAINLKSFELDCQDSFITRFPSTLLEDPNLSHYWHNLNALDLSNNRLTTLPPEIKRLKNLLVLFLSENRIRRLPEEIGALKSLAWVFLEDNDLTSLPEEITKLKKLDTLCVVGNDLKVSVKVYKFLLSKKLIRNTSIEVVDEEPMEELLERFKDLTISNDLILPLKRKSSDCKSNFSLSDSEELEDADETVRPNKIRKKLTIKFSADDSRSSDSEALQDAIEVLEPNVVQKMQI